MNSLSRVRVPDQSYVSEARRAAAGLAARLGYSDTDTGRVAIVATELATNLVKHAGGGELLIGMLGARPHEGIEILALDKGPGIANLAECMRDGYSTAGSPGNGMGALRRLSRSLELYTQPGRGTVVSARIWPESLDFRNRAEGLEVDGISVPKTGETVCGDGWNVREQGAAILIAVVDGLGHGPLAAGAARAALECFHTAAPAGPLELLKRMHAALRSTRGAAAAIAEVDTLSKQVRFAGIGNIAAVIVSDQGTRHLVSMNGILGHEARYWREFSYEWHSSATLVLHSDGLATRWDLGAYPGASAKPLSVLAGLLYRDLNRERDDATVVVARERKAR